MFTDMEVSKEQVKQFRVSHMAGLDSAGAAATSADQDADAAAAASTRAAADGSGGGDSGPASSSGGGGVEFLPQVLTQQFWPTYTPLELNLPAVSRVLLDGVGWGMVSDCPWVGWNSCCTQSTPNTQHPTLNTLHSTPYTQHPVLTRNPHEHNPPPPPLRSSPTCSSASCGSTTRRPAAAATGGWCGSTRCRRASCGRSFRRARRS